MEDTDLYGGEGSTLDVSFGDILKILREGGMVHKCTVSGRDSVPRGFQIQPIYFLGAFAGGYLD